MIRLPGVVVLVAVLTACTAQTPATPPTSSTPPALSGLEPCELVKEADFQSRGFGSFSATPTPYPEIPGSCGFTFGKASADDLVVITGVIDTGYESEKAKNPGGHEGLIEGHTTYFYCGGAKGDIACAAWAAVAENKTLTMGLRQPNADESRLLLATQGGVTEVLRRLSQVS